MKKKRKNYTFKNQKCPACGLTVGHYTYKIVRGKKYHLECDSSKK